VATIRLAIARGITVLATAPLSRNCEVIVGETFGGKLSDGIMITSKCRLGSPPEGEVEAKLTQSLERSLAAMGIERVDLFFLYTNICEDDYVFAVRPDRQNVFAARWSVYAERLVPAMEELKAHGKIGHWGITGTGVPRTIIKALNNSSKPAVVQATTNLLDSVRSMRNFVEAAGPVGPALMTGASAGIGVDLAECFAKDGYNIILAARTESALREVAERLAKTYKISAMPIAADLGAIGVARSSPRRSRRKAFRSTLS